MPQYIEPPNAGLMQALLQIAQQKTQRQPLRDVAQAVAGAIKEHYKAKEMKIQQDIENRTKEALGLLAFAKQKESEQKTMADILEKFQPVARTGTSTLPAATRQGTGELLNLPGLLPSSRQPVYPEGTEVTPPELQKILGTGGFRLRPKEIKNIIGQDDLPAMVDMLKSSGVKEEDALKKAPLYVNQTWPTFYKALTAKTMESKREYTSSGIGEDQARASATAYNVPLTEKEIKAFAVMSQQQSGNAFQARRAAQNNEEFINDYGIKFPRSIAGKVDPYIMTVSNAAIDVLAPTKKASAVIGEVYGNFLNGVATDSAITANIKSFTDPVVAKIMKDPAYSTADDLRMGMAALVARGIAGEKGTLAEGDIKRAYALMPKFGDTTEQIKTKLASLTKMMEAGVDAAYGRIPSKFIATPAHERYDYLLGDIYKMLPKKEREDKSTQSVVPAKKISFEL